MTSNRELGIPRQSWRHVILNYRRTGYPWRDLCAHAHRIVHGYYSEDNNPSVRRWKHCSCRLLKNQWP